MGLKNISNGHFLADCIDGATGQKGELKALNPYNKLSSDLTSTQDATGHSALLMIFRVSSERKNRNLVKL